MRPWRVEGVGPFSHPPRGRRAPTSPDTLQRCFRSGGTAMVEMEDRWQAPAVEMADPRQEPAVEEGPRAMAGGEEGVLLLVPAAFVAGWRLGRTVGRLTGH